MDRREAYRVLASVDRQLVLQELLAADGALAIDALARTVAARRHGIRPSRVNEGQQARARVRLVHIHFPLVTAHDLVVVDRQADTATISEGATIDRMLEAGAQLETWPPDDLLAPPDA